MQIMLGKCQVGIHMSNALLSALTYDMGSHSSAWFVFEDVRTFETSPLTSLSLRSLSLISSPLLRAGKGWALLSLSPSPGLRCLAAHQFARDTVRGIIDLLLAARILVIIVEPWRCG